MNLVDGEIELEKENILLTLKLSDIMVMRRNSGSEILKESLYGNLMVYKASNGGRWPSLRELYVGDTEETLIFLEDMYKLIVKQSLLKLIESSQERKIWMDRLNNNFNKTLKINLKLIDEYEEESTVKIESMMGEEPKKAWGIEPSTSEGKKYISWKFEERIRDTIQREMNRIIVDRDRIIDPFSRIPYLTSGDRAKLINGFDLSKKALKGLTSKVKFQDYARKLRDFIASGATEDLYISTHASGETLSYLRERFTLVERRTDDLTYDDLMAICMIEGERVVAELNPVVIGEEIKVALESKSKKNWIDRVTTDYEKASNLNNFADLVSKVDHLLSPWEKSPLPQSLIDLFAKGVIVGKGESSKIMPIIGDRDDPDPLRTLLANLREPSWENIKVELQRAYKDVDDHITEGTETGTLKLMKKQFINSYVRNQTAMKEDRRANQTGRNPSGGKTGSCWLCNKAGHFAVSKEGTEVTCPNYDALNPTQREKAEKIKEERKAKWAKGPQKKGRPSPKKE